MIPAAPASQQHTDASARPASLWQQLWRQAERDPRRLLARLGLEAEAARLSDQAAAQFALRVPQGFINRMRRGDLNDPLLRQVLPLADEMRLVPGFSLDAVGDTAAKKATGVIQKYQGRALLVTTGSCAIHCRYCFRRHFDYAGENAARGNWGEAVAAIAADPSIDEVILSGGDPLSLATPKLAELTGQLASIAHLRRLRIHTRLPVVLPERVDEELLAWLASLPWPVALVIHANHANEFDQHVFQAMAALRSTGVALLNEAVLLAGVNDSVDALCALSQTSFAAGVLPYYLFQLDRVQGTAHFEVPDARALELVEGVRRRLSGYLVPRLAREIAGEASKRPL